MARNDFAAALMRQMGIAHYDDGGIAGPSVGGDKIVPGIGASNIGGGYIYNGVGNSDPLLNKITSGNKVANAVVNPMNTISNFASDPAGFLGVKNSFQAGNPYDSSYLQGMVNNQGQIFGQQQNLAQALQAQMYGVGPNPAQAQYQANTQQNIANTQGLIASQRGLNPALAARMGANAATNANAQASQQAAILQAQQQLAAQGQLGALYGQEQTGNLGYQHLYDQMASAAQNINASVAAQNAQAQQKIVGGLMNGIGGMMGQGMSMAGSMFGMSRGGRVRGYDSGGAVDGGDPFGSSPIYGQMTMPQDDDSLEKGISSLGGNSEKSGGGKGGGGGGMGLAALALLSSGGAVPINFMPGGSVPGRATVSGNSPKNDTVPAMLSPGELVIPRSMAHDPEKAKEFIDHLLKQEGKKKSGYGDVLKARRKKAT